MKVEDLISELSKLPQDKSILCQVTAENDLHAWNMFFELHDIEESSFVQLNIYHPDLKELPDMNS